MKTANIVALALIIVGGINWGLVGAAQFNLVETLFGPVADSAITKIVYVLVGLAAIYSIMLFRPVTAASALTGVPKDTLSTR